MASGKAAEGVSGAQQKPAAWGKGSINPLTNRSSGTPVQNGVKSPPPEAKDVTNGDKQAQNRMLFLLANMKGLSVAANLKTGDNYVGIFSALSDNRYILKMVKKLPAAGKQANGVAEDAGTQDVMSFSVHDVANLSVGDVRFDKAQSKGQNGARANFATDGAISSNWQGRERELQPWTGAGDSANNVDMSLGSSGVGKWDQFAQHKKMTGLDSTYDESHYTTKIDRSRADYEQRSKDAERIAREIEGSSSTNAHVAEERGQKHLDDSGLDEEAKYSGVQRGEYQPLPSGGANKYTPPARRAPTGQPTVSGAPVDPSIIDSKFADQPKPKPEAAKNEPAPAKVEPSKAAAEKEAAAKAALPPKPSAEKSTAQAPVPKPTGAAFRGATKEGGATATVEKDVHEAFKEFTRAEKLKVQEAQRSLARRDKAVKLNDLKKFAQNFKLTTEVPSDLLPILARDERKQVQIQEKAKKNAEETKSTPPRSTATSAAATPQEPKATKPTSSRDNATPMSPPHAADRRDQHRERQPSQNAGGSAKGPPPHMQQSNGMPHRPAHTLGPRLQQNGRQNRQGPSMNPPMPIPDPRFAHQGYPGPGGMLASPTNGPVRFNPASATFVPGTNNSSGSSPVRAGSSRPAETRAPKPGNLFEGRTEGRKSAVPASERVSLESNYNYIKTAKKEVQDMPAEERKKFDFTGNGGIQNAFRTPPTWDALVPEANREKTVQDMFPATLKSAQTAQNPGAGQQPMHFQHQLPYGGGPRQQMPPQGMNPGQMPHMVGQPHPNGPGGPHHFEDNRMTFSQSTGGVHPSPRVAHQQQFPYNPPNGMQYGAMYGSSPNQFGMGMSMSRQPSNNPQMQFVPHVVVPGPPQQFMGHGMPSGPFQAVPGGPPFYPQGPHMAPQPGQNGYNSPARQPVMMAPSNSQQGHNHQVMPGYGYQAMPMQQMRYQGGPPQHQQFPNSQQQHFGAGPHPAMRGTPSASYAQPVQQYHGPPQGVPPGGMPQDGPDDAK